MSATRNFVIVSAIGLFTVPAGAAVLFHETFENYEVNGDTNQGIPKLSEGSMELWYGGRFGTPSDGSIHDDVAIRRNPDAFPLQDTYARFEDDAGIIFKISTVGFTNINLQFQWLTHELETNDRFVMGYYIGAIDFVNDTADGTDNNLVHRFNTDGPAWNMWTQLMSDTNPNTWDTENFALPANTANIYVAFWMNDGEGDYGKVDNVLVTGTAIPAPGALTLVGLGGLMGLRNKRRRSDR